MASADHSNNSNSDAMAVLVVYSAVAKGVRGGRGPPNDCLCPPHFGLLKLLFLEHHVTARQQQ